MDVYECIQTKRAVRQFADRPVADEVVARILMAGRASGSSRNSQPWRFIVLRDRENLDRLASFGRYASHVREAAFAVIVVTETPKNAFDAGRTAQNMMLAAWGEGVGSCPVTLHYEDRAKAFLKIPEDRKVPVALVFGYLKEGVKPLIEGKPRERVLVHLGRKPIEELVFWERYGQRSR
ncbi:MAG: nitroreductase family protein [Candidatus Bipolaricaulia bacterium]